MASPREVVGSPQELGVNESRACLFDVSDNGDNPTGYTVTAWDITSGAKVDASDVFAEGSVSADGNVITSKPVNGLIAYVGHKLRIEAKYTIDGETFVDYAILDVTP